VPDAIAGVHQPHRRPTSAGCRWQGTSAVTWLQVGSRPEAACRMPCRCR
jgi:hypothetical protein